MLNSAEHEFYPAHNVEHDKSFMTSGPDNAQEPMEETKVFVLFVLLSFWGGGGGRGNSFETTLFELPHGIKKIYARLPCDPYLIGSPDRRTRSLMT